MKINIDNELYNLEIVKKRTTKNTYIRVKDDLTVSVTTNIFTSDKSINKIIMENINSIKNMINKTKKKNTFKEEFYFLGKKYDIVYTNTNDIRFGLEKVFIGKDMDVDKYLKREASILFLEHLDKIYRNFSKKIPYPSLTIRKMTSRWGVCNTRDNRVTLNLELIKKDISCLDYVIVHELSHLIHHDHSGRFWSLVEENYPDYKKIRKQMKEY